MTLWPQSLIGRTLLVLIVGLVVSQVISSAFYARERSSALHSVGARQVAERVAQIYDRVDAASITERRRVVRETRGPGLRVWWTPQATMPLVPDGDSRERVMRDYLGDYLGDQPAGDLRIRYLPSDQMNAEQIPGGGFRTDMRHMMRRHMGAKGMHLGDVLRLSVQLTDKSWLNVVAPFVEFRPFWQSSFFFSGLLVTAVVLAVSVWAVGRAARPLRLFAQAATRLGEDVNAPPMDVTGPREVRRAAVAFNDMQGRLQHFINDRTRMFAAISHDLRTPITRLRLRAEFVEDVTEREKMLRDLTDMEAMISATMAFARDDVAAETVVEFDLAELVATLCDDVSGPVKCETPPQLTFRGRPLGLKRAIGNLVDNALAYGETAKVTLREHDGTAILAVIDTGPGIPDAMLDQVFDPFFRVDASRNRASGGTGLGLSVVRSVVTAHGGTVELKNRAKGGLVATMALPKSS